MCVCVWVCVCTCRYSKEEGLVPGSQDMMRYQFLLVSTSDYKHHYVGSHVVVGKAVGFSKVVLSGSGFPLRPVLEDRVLVLHKRGSEPS